MQAFSTAELAGVLKALAEPRRIEIMRLVRGEEMAAGEIAARFDVTRPAISQHLRVLADAGLLWERKAGTRRLYRARPEGMTELQAFLAEFWDERLTALKFAVEADAQSPTRARGTTTKSKRRKSKTKE